MREAASRLNRWAGGVQVSRSATGITLAMLLACCRRAEVREASAGPGAGDGNTPVASSSRAAPEAGAPGTERVPPNGPCATDLECGAGFVCEGCGEEDRRCIRGCREDKDCAAGETCRQVQCVRCPCPPLCG